MREIWSRAGMAVVSDSPKIDIEAAPVRGAVIDLGAVRGVRTFRLDADPHAPTWIYAHRGAVHALSGAVAHVGTGGHQVQSSLVVLGPLAVVREHIGNRKGRDAGEIVLYREGERQWNVPAPVLLALGLVPADDAQHVPAPVAPPEPDTAMAAAFRKAGIGCDA